MTAVEEPPSISVVVPTYNRVDSLRRTLDSLLAQDVAADALEVIVSDDGSSDGTRALCDSYRDRLRLRYTFQEDLGYRVAAARNAGARLATAPVLAFLDSGTVAGPEFVTAHLRHHRAGEAVAVIGYTHAYDNIDGASADVLSLLANESPQAVVARLGDTPQLRDARHDDLAERDFDLARLAAPWRFFWTINVSLRRADYWAVGGFDEEFVGWGAEDMELGYRLHHAGVPMVLSRRAWALETPHQRDVAANLASNIRNLIRLQSKHDGPETELFCACRRRQVPVQRAYDEFAAWTSAVRPLDVRAELADLAGAPADLVAGRVAVFGGGTALPDGWPACTVLDFDAAALAKAVAGTAHTGHHGIGVRTLLPDGAFDLVLVSSRLAGLWKTWGDDLLAEAGRLGREIRVFHNPPGVTGPGTASSR